MPAPLRRRLARRAKPRLVSDVRGHRGYLPRRPTDRDSRDVAGGFGRPREYAQGSSESPYPSRIQPTGQQLMRLNAPRNRAIPLPKPSSTRHPLSFVEAFACGSAYASLAQSRRPTLRGLTLGESFLGNQSRRTLRSEEPRHAPRFPSVQFRPLFGNDAIAHHMSADVTERLGRDPQAAADSPTATETTTHRLDRAPSAFA